jgi:hypothetical protein
MHCQLKTKVFTGCVWVPAVIKSRRVRCSLNVADTGRRDTHRGADNFLARPGSKQATATEEFEFHISYL